LLKLQFILLQLRSVLSSIQHNMTNYGFNGNDMDEAQPSIPTTANTPEQEEIIKNSTAIDSLRCQNEELLKMIQALSQALLQPSVSSQTTIPQHQSLQLQHQNPLAI